MSIYWDRVSKRMNELEDRQSELLNEYKGIGELIAEDIEEEDIDSLKMHVSDITDTLRDLQNVRDELGLLCEYVDNACEEKRYGSI